MEKKKKNSLSIEKIGFSIIILTIVVYLLTITRALAIPLVIALIIFYIFTNIANYLRDKLLKRFIPMEKLRGFLANIFTLAILLIGIFSLSSIISTNIENLREEAPKYEGILRAKLTKFTRPLPKKGNDGEDPYSSTAAYNFEIEADNYDNFTNIRELAKALDADTSTVEEEEKEPTLTDKLVAMSPPWLKGQLEGVQMPDMGKVAFENIDFGFIQKLGGMLGDVAKNTTMIIIYLLFLVLERKSLKQKVLLLGESNKSFGNFVQIATKINHDILEYLKIKSMASFFTGFLSYIVLEIAGVDFASFWAILIFVLNFIPTIGSIVAVIFPFILSVILFENISSAFILGAVLTSIQMAIGNLIEPRFLGKTLNLSPIAIFLFLVIWGKIWGILGMFLAVPIMVVVNIILAQFEQTRTLAIILSGNGIIHSESREEREERKKKETISMPVVSESIISDASEVDSDTQRKAEEKKLKEIADSQIEAESSILPDNAE